MATDIDSCRRKCTRIFVLLNLCVYCFSRGDDLRSEDSIRWVKAGECFSKAVESIEMRCKDMNTDERFFLQLNFTNCYLSMMGVSTVDCSGLTRRECSGVLNQPQNKLQDSVFEKFSRDLITLCYHAANHLWQKSVSSRTSKLKEFSIRMLQDVVESVNNNKQLKTQQQQSLNNQENMLHQAKNIKSSVQDQHKEMNKQFDNLTSNITQQTSRLQSFGSQLRFSLEWISFSVVSIFGEAIEFEIILIFFFLFVFFACLSSVHEARGVLKIVVFIVGIDVLVEFILYMCAASSLLDENNKMISVSLLRKFGMFLSVFLYVVVVVRRLLRPHVEDYNTHQLIHHLSEEIKDMETYLMSAGLLPPGPAPPIQSSSPQILPAPPPEQRRGHQTEEEDCKDAGHLKIVPESTKDSPFKHFPAGVIDTPIPDNQRVLSPPRSNATINMRTQFEFEDVADNDEVDASMVREEVRDASVVLADNKEAELRDIQKSSLHFQRTSIGKRRSTKNAKKPTRQRKEQGKREPHGVVDESVSNRYNLRPRRSLYSPSNDNKSSRNAADDDSSSGDGTSRSFNSRTSFK